MDVAWRDTADWGVTEGFGCGRERPERSDLADQP